MSGVQKFVGRRANPPQSPGLEADPERSQRLNAWMGQMGLNPSLIASKIGPNAELERRSTSRQAVADRSRVSTPPSKPQKVGPNTRAAPQQSHASLQTTLATRTAYNDQQPAHQHSHSEIKMLGAFDTDTEKLDDTTDLKGLDNSVDLPVKSDADPENLGHPANQYFDTRALQAARKHQSEFSSRAPASFVSEDYAETNVDNDGDDEYDDPSQFEDFQLDVKDDSGSFHPEGAAFSLQIYPQDVRSVEAAPEPVEETKSEVDNAAPLKFSRPIEPSAARYMTAGEPGDHNAGNPRLQFEDSKIGITAIKRKQGPQLEAQKATQDVKLAEASAHSASNPFRNQDVYNVPQHSDRDSYLLSVKAQRGLDYEPKVLASMSYQELAEESFDASPQPISVSDPSLTDKSTLKDKLLYLHSLSGPREQIQLQRQAFFSSLPIDQYEEYGDLMAEQFRQIISKFKDARQQKRSIAREFEDEIAAREKVVDSRKIAVASDLSRLKRAGQDVVRGK
ncbi:MAG: hypothetical protein Q9225_002812 [Loekoesia sp. 1 TL-2023]